MKHPGRDFLVVVAAMIFFAGAQALAGSVLYIDASAPTGGDGQSWATAYKYLQDGLANATTGDRILVAQGVYSPDDDEAGAVTAGDRYATFTLISGVAIEGGYAGRQAGDPDERDPETYRTILSGDLAGNDGPHYANYDDNTRTLVTADGVDTTTVLDGLVITAASQGAMENEYGSPTLIHCRFEDNYADVANDLCGGIKNISGSPVIRDCMFLRNRGMSGGALYNMEGSQPTLINCSFLGNEANAGGAMLNRASNPSVINCIFSGNWSWSNSGGGVRNLNESQPIFYHCVFVANVGCQARGAIGSYDADVILINCIIWDNLSGTGTQIEEPITLYSCCVQGGWSGPGDYNIDADPLFINPAGADGIYGTEDDDFRLQPGSPCLDAGDNILLPADVLDLDNDGYLNEPVPFDRDGGERIIDEPDIPDTGQGWRPIVDIGAYESARQHFIVSSPEVTVPEGGTAAVSVTLALPPQGQIEVTVRPDGDSDVTVSSPATLSFDAQNYAIPQTVEVQAAQDADTFDGRCTIRLEADGVSNGGFLAIESDDDERVIYVDLNATGANNGSSWNDAFVSLQDGLAEAATLGGEVWVAQGRYTPDQGQNQTRFDRTVSFEMVNGVTIYGGFAGMEIARDQRDPEKYETILSGDLQGNDGPDFSLRDDNSYSVVTAAWVDESSILDGVTVTGGNATGGGQYHGGGLYITDHSQLIIRHCSVKLNQADYGGGGYIENFSSPSFLQCRFTGNQASSGGGLSLTDPSNPVLVNCLITDNYAEHDGGGIYGFAVNMIVDNCTFVGNQSSQGSAIGHRYYGFDQVTNCIMWGNNSTWGETILAITAGEVNVSYSCVEGGWTGTGNIAANPLFADQAGGDYRLAVGSPCIDAGLNEAVPEGITVDLAGRPRFVSFYTPGDPAVPVDMGAFESKAVTLDFDGDGDADFKDVRFMKDCMSGPYIEIIDPTCQQADLDDDGDVDLADFAREQQCLSGSTIPVDWSCAEGW